MDETVETPTPTTPTTDPKTPTIGRQAGTAFVVATAGAAGYFVGSAICGSIAAGLRARKVRRQEKAQQTAAQEYSEAK